MTLKMSLEINRKMQAVLEDTLMKNITLKVGGSIIKLTMGSVHSMYLGDGEY